MSHERKADSVTQQDAQQGDGHDVLRAHDYAQPFSEAEIEEMWETHAGDNPECQTCRILITLAHVGAPGGAAADRAEQGVLESAYHMALMQIEADGATINRLTQALRVATHSPHDQLGEPNEGFPVCSVCGAIQTAADRAERGDSPYGWHADGDLCLGPECGNLDDATGDHSPDVHPDAWWEGFEEAGRRAADRAERGLPLDVAWAEAEAALPEGWWLRGVWHWADPYEGAYWRAEAENFGPDAIGHEEGTGDTPAAALHALAAHLAADPQSPEPVAESGHE